MKKTSSVFTALLIISFMLASLVTMSNNIDGIIHMDQASPQDSSYSLLIDINTATAEELMLLPAVGENLANNIISYRNEHGPFDSVSDVQKIKGIGTEIFRQISPYLTVGGSS